MRTIERRIRGYGSVDWNRGRPRPVRIRYDDGHAKALAFDTLLREMIRRRRLSIGWVTPTIHEEALELFRRYSEHRFSIVDCASFVVARRKKIREVFGFDRDFVTLGFTLKPS